MPGKLSEIYYKVPLFSNPGDKVLKCVKTRGQICPDYVEPVEEQVEEVGHNSKLQNILFNSEIFGNV